MRSFVRFCMVSIVLVTLAFLCEGLRDNLFTEPDSGTVVLTTSGDITDPIQSEHSFIRFNTPCLSSPTAEGQTVTRTATGASGSPCRNARKTELDFRMIPEIKAFCHLTAQRHSLPSLRKLRL